MLEKTIAWGFHCSYEKHCKNKLIFVALQLPIHIGHTLLGVVYSFKNRIFLLKSEHCAILKLKKKVKYILLNISKHCEFFSNTHVHYSK